MANTKEYKIVINGLTESINAVESLNKQLDTLEKRMNAINSTNVSAGSSSRGGNNTALSEEERAQREINKLKEEGERLDAKIAATQDEIYKRVDATKQLYKETVADQKALAAAERLQADAYSNTMVGMKQQLADIKAVIQTTDLGDNDKIKKMTEQANELTNKLKQMEEAYGQFGRNVGNYKSAVDGFKKLTIEVNGVTRSFDNAKQALKTLKSERDTMGVGAGKTTQEFKNLDEVVKQLQSDIKDLDKSSATMDNLLDTFESFAAIGTISTGFASLFGVDDSEIEKSIKKMVAFQNVLKGIETINRQIQTREGVGAWIAPFTVQIDKATAKVLVFNRALLGTGTAAKVAAKGITLMSKALKAIVSIGIIVVIELIIEKVMDLIESFNELSEAEKVQKEIEEAMADAYGKGMAKLTQYKARLDAFNGSKKEEKKLVEELNKEFGDTLGTYKSIAEWQDVLDKKGKAYIETLKLQAKAQAALNAVTAAYANLMKVQMGIANGEYDGLWNKIFGKSGEARLVEAQKMVEDTSKILEDATKEQEEFNRKNKLGDYAPQIKKNTEKTKNALEDSQKTLNQLELRLMREGLNKKLRQLDEEERQTINKLKENGRKNALEIQKIQRAYNQLRAKEIQDYLLKLEESINKSAQDIKRIKFEINLNDIEIQLEDLKNQFNEIDEEQINRTLVSRTDLRQIFGNSTLEGRLYANEFNEKKLEAEATKQYDEYYKFLRSYLKTQNQKVKDEFWDLFSEVGEEQAYSDLAEKFEREYSDALSAIRSYGSIVLNVTNEMAKENTELLNASFSERLENAEKYYNNTITQLRENIQKQSELNKKRIKEQFEQDEEAERERYTKQYQELDLRRQMLEEDIKNFKVRNDKEKEAYEKLKKELDETNKQMEEALMLHGEKMGQINEKKDAAIIKSDQDTYKEISSIQEKYFNAQITNYRDFQSKLNDEISRNPITDKAGFGIVNISATKKNYSEIIAASKTAIDAIRDDKRKLDKLYDDGFITPEAYNATLSQLTDLEKEMKNGMMVVEENSKQLVGEFIASINQYVQAVGQTIDGILQAIWDYQDYQLEKEQDELDKYNELLDKKLDEQQEIVEKHKSAIDDIEDELATARGDRRQHLIDQLNAEMQAQREAAAQEKKIKKEQEAAEQKQEQLEKKRREQEYKRNVTQAFISWHLGVANALATQPFMPVGIAMGALATALGGVQYALVKSQKPYAKGGLLEGPDHKHGGIPVGNTGIEVEGKEYVVRKSSTAKNIDLLDYINKSERKLSLDDFISFYSGKVKRNVTSMSPGRKYADGGSLPTLSNDYEFDDRLLNAMEDYSNRPVVVSVVDINNRQAAVKNVQVLAGVED